MRTPWKLERQTSLAMKAGSASKSCGRSCILGACCAKGRRQRPSQQLAATSHRSLLQYFLHRTFILKLGPVSQPQQGGTPTHHLCHPTCHGNPGSGSHRHGCLHRRACQWTRLAGIELELSILHEPPRRTFIQELLDASILSISGGSWMGVAVAVERSLA